MNVWDWKFRIFFDDSIKEKLCQWKKTLAPAEAKVYDDIQHFYLSFYSFGVLWDLINEAPDKASDYIRKADENKSLIIKTPEVLVRYYRKEIKLKYGNSEFGQSLLDILVFSMNGREISKDYWHMVSQLYGISYDDLISKFACDDFDHQFWNVPRQKVIVGNCKSLFDEIYDAVSCDPKLNNKFGCSAIQDFGTQIIDGNGYGEWWDREISDTGRDELVLYTNDNQVKCDDYKYTIIHETYPGHGHFYNYVRAQNDCMDHGAMSLVEGWATYCEWNTYPSKYVNVIKHNALSFLWESYNLSLDEFANSIAKRNRKKRKPLRKYISNLIYSTQYIGYIEAYYLGAIWMELLFHRGKYTPKSFLDMLSKTNKGEFFRLWQ